MTFKARLNPAANTFNMKAVAAPLNSSLDILSRVIFFFIKLIIDSTYSGIMTISFSFNAMGANRGRIGGADRGNLLNY